MGAGQAAPLETRSVRSRIPTLVLAGGFDPITPPAWAAEAASTLRNATTVEFDPLSHGVSSGQGCPAQIATAFLDDPEATLDVSCAASIAPPQFVAGESGEVVMEPFDTVLLGVPLSGLAPQGWDEVAPGSFARLETPVDPTALVLQAGQGLTSEQLLGLVAGQLGFTLPDQPDDTHEGGGRSWPLYEVSIQGSPALVTATELGEYAAVGIIIANPEELDALRGRCLPACSRRLRGRLAGHWAAPNRPRRLIRMPGTVRTLHINTTRRAIRMRSTTRALAVGALLAISLTACSQPEAGITTHTDPERLSLIEVPSEWHLYESDEMAELESQVFTADIDGLPIEYSIAFDGAPSRDPENVNTPFLTADSPSGPRSSAGWTRGARRHLSPAAQPGRRPIRGFADHPRASGAFRVRRGVRRRAPARRLHRPGERERGCGVPDLGDRR